MAKLLFDGGDKGCDGIKFVDNTGVTTAILDVDGRFSLRDPSGSLEIFDSWTDFIKNMGDVPVNTKDPQQAIDQMVNMGLGNPVYIAREPNTTKGAARTRAASEAAAANEPTKVVKEKEMATKAAAPAKPAAKKPVAKKKVVAEAPSNPCICGCGAMVSKNFAPGHDARVHGWELKVARGEAKFSEYPAIAQKFMKERGVKQGVKSAA